MTATEPTPATEDIAAACAAYGAAVARTDAPALHCPIATPQRRRFSHGEATIDTNRGCSMNRCVSTAINGIAFLVLILVSTVAAGADLKVISAIGMQEVMEDVGPKFERASGHKLTIVFATLGPALKRIEGGETADVIVLPAQGVDTLVNDGKATGDAKTVARSQVGVAVRKGTPKPDISSPETFKQSMLAAKSIFISDPARGGIGTPHVLKVFERLGIADEMKRKTTYTKVAGRAGIEQALVETDVNLSLNQLQEFAPVAGMEIVGPLPGDLALSTTFSVVAMAGSKHADAAQALVSYLRTPEAAVDIRRRGLEPAF
jgi:molybdate transport system substrate-binding protein